MNDHGPGLRVARQTRDAIRRWAVEILNHVIGVHVWQTVIGSDLCRG